MCNFILNNKEGVLAGDAFFISAAKYNQHDWVDEGEHDYPYSHHRDDAGS